MGRGEYPNEYVGHTCGPYCEHPSPYDRRYYAPFDQEAKLGPPPWRATNPEVRAWEEGHGHDVRLKCYPEYQCRAIAADLEAQNEDLRAQIEKLEASARGHRICEENMDAEIERLRARPMRDSLYDGTEPATTLTREAVAHAFHVPPELLAPPDTGPVIPGTICPRCLAAEPDTALPEGRRDASTWKRADDLRHLVLRHVRAVLRPKGPR